MKNRNEVDQLPDVNTSTECSVDKQIQAILNEHVIYTTTDLRGIIEKASPAFCRRSGYTEDELIGRTHSLLRAPDTLDDVYDDLWNTIENDEIWHGELKNVSKNGQSYWIKCMISPLYCGEGKKIGYIAIRDNITREKEIEAHAMMDEVTQIYNRRKINQDIIIAIERYERYGTPFSFVMFDIDLFKSFNDRYGHLVGDEVLVQVSNLIDSQTRLSDIFARWGGDEFALLIPETGREQALQLCEKLRRAVIESAGERLRERFDIAEEISCSFGVTAIQKGDTIDSLLGRTDRALYLAKEHGRNRVELL